MEPRILLNILCVFLDGHLYICLFSTLDKHFLFTNFHIFVDIILLPLHGIRIDTVYLDFAKAFDKVHNNIVFKEYD